MQRGLFILLSLAIVLGLAPAAAANDEIENEVKPTSREENAFDTWWVSEVRQIGPDEYVNLEPALVTREWPSGMRGPTVRLDLRNDTAVRLDNPLDFGLEFFGLDGEYSQIAHWSTDQTSVRCQDLSCRLFDDGALIFGGSGLVVDLISTSPENGQVSFVIKPEWSTVGVDSAVTVVATLVSIIPGMVLPEEFVASVMYEVVIMVLPELYRLGAAFGRGDNREVERLVGILGPQMFDIFQSAASTTLVEEGLEQHIIQQTGSKLDRMARAKLAAATLAPKLVIYAANVIDNLVGDAGEFDVRYRRPYDPARIASDEVFGCEGYGPCAIVPVCYVDRTCSEYEPEWFEHGDWPRDISDADMCRYLVDGQRLDWTFERCMSDGIPLIGFDMVPPPATPEPTPIPRPTLDVSGEAIFAPAGEAPIGVVRLDPLELDKDALQADFLAATRSIDPDASCDSGIAEEWSTTDDAPSIYADGCHYYVDPSTSSIMPTISLSGAADGTVELVMFNLYSFGDEAEMRRDVDTVVSTLAPLVGVEAPSLADAVVAAYELHGDEYGYGSFVIKDEAALLVVEAMAFAPDGSGAAAAGALTGEEGWQVVVSVFGPDTEVAAGGHTQGHTAHYQWAHVQGRPADGALE